MNRTAYDSVKIARGNNRPTGLDYIKEIFTEFFELHGDRRFADDPAIVGGIATLKGQPVTVIAIDKGKDMRERVKRNFGSPNPEGYRKALRLAHQAEKFHRPVINFVDTSGAYPGAGAEERGQGEAIARCLYEFIELRTPVVSIVTGEGGSGGALALAVADRVLMLENAIYSVVSPRACASILWKDPKREGEAAEALRLTAQDLYEFGMIEGIVPEGQSGAQIIRNVGRALRDCLGELAAEQDIDILLQKRYEKFRKIGVFRQINQDENEGV